MSMARKSFLVVALCLVQGLVAFTPGSDGRRNVDLDVRFVPLELDEEVYEGLIYDEKNTFKVTNISFAGVTKILGVKNDGDDSSNILRLSNIKSLKVLDPHYRSPRHTTNDNMFFFVKVHVVHNTPNEVAATMLIPHNIILCGEDLVTGTEKAWRLRDITSFEINHSPVGPDINRPTERIVRTSKLPAPSRSQRGVMGAAWEGLIDGIQSGVQSFRNWLSKTA